MNRLRLFATLTALLVALVLTACGNNAEPSDPGVIPTVTGLPAGEQEPAPETAPEAAPVTDTTAPLPGYPAPPAPAEGAPAPGYPDPALAEPTPVPPGYVEPTAVP